MMNWKLKSNNDCLKKVLILIFCTVSFNIKAQQSEINRKSDSIYFAGPTLFDCHIQFPANYSPLKSYPLIIGLHGGGGSYKTFRNIWLRFENPQFLLATPQAPYKWLMGDDIGYDWSAWPTGNITFMAEALNLTSKYIESLINSLSENYNIEKAYLLGFSQGSIIAQIAGIHNHDLLRGIIIFSGPEINHPGRPEIVWPSAEAISSAKNLEVIIVHGRNDSIVDIELAYKSKKIYEKYGFEVSMFEFEGGHEIDEGALKRVEKKINRRKTQE